jgi:hypothetical protein
MLTSPRSVFHHCSRVDSITSRTAVYGPVRTVVWEGWRSDLPPYPDQECSPARQRAKAAMNIKGLPMCFRGCGRHAASGDFQLLPILPAFEPVVV